MENPLHVLVDGVEYDARCKHCNEGIDYVGGEAWQTRGGGEYCPATMGGEHEPFNPWQTGTAVLTQAYHLIFDFKDAQVSGSDLFVQCADTLRSLRQTAEAMGITLPERFDAPRQREIGCTVNHPVTYEQDA